MEKLHASTKLKVNNDTFFLPDANGGVYFRNNSSSFRMQGDGIYQWIEKLIPMFNGKHTLAELTNELPLPYQKRVFEIGEFLYHNGFVRDVSQALPHSLDDTILNQYASQIEFLEHFTPSGSMQFQRYRQANVLAIGSGPFLHSLVSSLLESGLPKFHFLITDASSTNRLRLEELAEHARKTDPEVSVTELHAEATMMQDLFQPFEWILYASQDGNLPQLRAIHTQCREEKKHFLPAISLAHVGLAGPVITAECTECWESAWHRIHAPALEKDLPSEPLSPIAGAMLANIIVFELFKTITGVQKQEDRSEFFLLDLETLEGRWHAFLPHPLDKQVIANVIEDIDEKVTQQRNDVDSEELLHYFSRLTSKQSGIFHIWEEQNLKQLPLSQCYMQASNPQSEGPAELLPTVICGGLTHEEAQREAGLTGIEMYVSNMVDRLVPKSSNMKSLRQPQEYLGIGAGASPAEGFCRGLQSYLEQTLRKRQSLQKEQFIPVLLQEIDDKHCAFYLHALTTIHTAPVIGFGKDMLGFPVVFVSIDSHWYSSTGLHVTLALRNALKQALLHTQNHTLPTHILDSSSILVDESEPLLFSVPSYEEIPQVDSFQAAMQTLKENHLSHVVFDLAVEPFLQEQLAGVFGVLVREEEN